MKLWREILDGKLMGGVLCVVLLLSFALQIAGASRAAASMIAPDPLSILCTSSDSGAHRPADPKHPMACPCAELCAAGIHLAPAPAPSDATGIPIRFADRIEIAVDHSAPLTASAPGRPYEARGPPSVSI